MTKPITIEYLEEIQSDQNLNQSDKEFLEGVLDSLNDWRTGHDFLEDYLIEIEKFVGGNLTEQNIRNAIRSTNPMNNAWEVESLEGLAECLSKSQSEKDLRTHIASLLEKVG